jgi:hypothetical protein
VSVSTSDTVYQSDIFFDITFYQPRFGQNIHFEIQRK